MSLQGCTITADAMHCLQETARFITQIHEWLVAMNLIEETENGYRAKAECLTQRIRWETKFSYHPPPRALSRHGASGGITSAMKNNKSQSILSPQQEAVLQQMLPIAKIATNGEITDLPIRPRTHTLVIGPSGSGKSFIAQEIGRRLNLPVLLINVTSWVVLSAKNEPWTTSLICNWLDSIGNIGGILVYDEVDKIHEGSEWMSYIRNELHDLLDGVIPHAARMPNQPTEDLWESTPNIESQRLTRTMLTSRLRNKVFVIACGAFQTAWTSISRKIGFEIETEYSEMPSRLQILASINPEVRQRFRDDACWLEPMKLKDFQGLSTRIGEELPCPSMRRSWHRLAKPAIERAVAGGLGMRIFEELMLSVLLDKSTVSTPHIKDGKQPYI